MIKQLFATMNDALDEIISEYPNASESRRRQLTEKLNVLKQMSDTFIEQWLLFEEKMGKLTPDAMPKGVFADFSDSLDEVVVHPVKESSTDSFARGQGYFKLLMFRHAIREFEDVVSRHPDFLLARLYLALGYLQTSDFAEAYRHLQFIIPMTEDSRMKAVAFNALGCIQVKNDNLEQAEEYFRLAHTLDPALPEPLRNLSACMEQEGELHFGLGLGFSH